MRQIIAPLVGLSLLVLTATAPLAGECHFKFCKNRVETATKTYPITNPSRQRLGDIYDPGHGRRTQIRNNRLQILGYIEADGTITNPNRQRIGTIEELSR